LQERPGWQIVGQACDGLEAVQRSAELAPDLVILDIGMPFLNGIEAAKQIRQVSPATKIIFLTQDNDADLEKAALALGAEAYVVKSNVASALLPTIDGFIEKRLSED